MTTIWFDRVKACVGWDTTDQAQIAKLRNCLDSDLTGVVESLGRRLAQFKGTQPLMANARFVQRLHGVLREWLNGLLGATFDEEYVRARWAFGQRLAEVELTFEDVILLEGLVQEQLSELARERSDGHHQAFSATMHTLEKALCLDLALLHSSFLQMHDAQMERNLLDRFLTVTGFSRTLYENLAEVREWNGAGIEQARLF